jgi:hypothetical protein
VCGTEEYANLPNLVMGIPCPQHRPAKMVEVLKYYQIPCTVAVEKHALLQAMLLLQATLTDAEINIITLWLVAGGESFKEAVQASRLRAFGEEWAIYDRDFFADDSDTESDVTLAGENLIEEPVAAEDNLDCRICLESFPAGRFLQEGPTPSCDAQKEDHRFCVKCLENHIASQATDPEFRQITCPICRAELHIDTVRDFSSRQTFDT